MMCTFKIFFLNPFQVCFEGKGGVRWTEERQVTRDGKTETERDTFSAHETYFNYEVSVYNGPQLPPGIHNFPFSFTLPQNIPSSYESRVGHVRYEIKGQIVRDWKWDHRVRRLITVNGIVDLNHSPANRQPSESRNHKTLCCFCRASGPISAVIHTHRYFLSHFFLE